jgi:hypothetical protein
MMRMAMAPPVIPAAPLALGREGESVTAVMAG